MTITGLLICILLAIILTVAGIVMFKYLQGDFSEPINMNCPRRRKVWDSPGDVGTSKCERD